MLLELLLLQAAAGTSGLSSRECQNSIASLIASAPNRDSRVVVTFTGTQEALLPLDEQVGPAAETTLFPIGADRFVLTIQVRPVRSDPVTASTFANRVCALGARTAARFNGVMTFVRETKTVGGVTLTRERMTDAAMAKLPEK
jgi:hypothetical protein